MECRAQSIRRPLKPLPRPTTHGSASDHEAPPISGARPVQDTALCPIRLGNIRPSVEPDDVRCGARCRRPSSAVAAEPFAVRNEGDPIIVTSRVSGTFPGSPVDLRHAFRLEGKLVSHLEINL